MRDSRTVLYKRKSGESFVKRIRTRYSDKRKEEGFGYGIRTRDSDKGLGSGMASNTKGSSSRQVRTLMLGSIFVKIWSVDQKLEILSKFNDLFVRLDILCK